MLTFVYCLDENYNKQSACSIYSLLENVDEKIKIFVIHNDPNKFQNIPEKILNHKNLGSIKILQKKLRDVYYPNLNYSHVSEATYYRLNLDEYFKNEEILIYLDSDIIFINNPIKLFNQEIDKLNESGFTISAKTETSLRGHAEKVMQLKSKKYFNAGVMIINIKKWKEDKITNQLFKTMNSISEKIIYWDQDVLNSYFDGDYSELNSSLNFQVEMDKGNNFRIQKDQLSSIILLHYSGKFKPWSVMGAANTESKYFHSIYKEIYDNYYLISYNYRLNALKDLLRIIFTLRIFIIKNRLNFLYTVLNSLLK